MYSRGCIPYDRGVTPLALAAAQLHEMFTELQAAGFTDTEALFLCGQMMRGGDHGEA